MKSNLPETKYATFNWEENPIFDWNKFIEGHISVPDNLTAYNVACAGDSGSGQFVQKGPRYVLVAIYSGSSDIQTFNSNGKEHDYPCGTFTWRTGKYRYWNDESESTTWEENLEWIKKKVKLCKTSSCNIS